MSVEWLAVARNRTGSVPWLGAAMMRVKAGFDEAAHPRDETGKFAEGGGGEEGNGESGMEPAGGASVGQSTPRVLYQPTPAQEKKWSELQLAPLPTDEEFKERWARSHHGKVAGWGMGKREWIVSNMKQSREYQMGIWQGRVDKARGLGYSEERNENTYNLGYYRGHTEYESNRRGWDQGTRSAFDRQYRADLLSVSKSWLVTASIRVKASLSAQCADCANFEGPYRAGYHCQAFPGGIPKDILEGRFDHEMPYPGDHGVQFEEEEGKSWLDIAHMRVKAGFDEAAHPRDETGKFAEGGDGASGDEEITEIEMDEDREMQRFQDAAESLASGLDLDPSIVQEEIADWAMDSQSKSGLLFQVAASQEFGLSMPQYLLDKAKTAGINVNADFAEERAILRVLHEKSSIRGDVTLYRGTTQESQENPLESWTTDRGIAAFYVRRNGEGRVVEQRFPASRILATHREGVGLESAKEVVVLGSGG